MPLDNIRRVARDMLRFRTRYVYQSTFNTTEGKAVLKDLLQFARFGKPITVPGDEGQSRFNDGMQRTVFRITKFLNMTDEEILRLAQQPMEASDGTET